MLLLYSSIFKAQVLSNCSVPPAFFNAYQHDVATLAYNRFASVTSPVNAPTHVPDAYRDTVWMGLAAILNSNTAQSDSVFNKYCVHTDDTSWYKNISIGLDSTVTWDSSYINGDTISGNLALDTILANYGYQLTNTLYPWLKWVYFHTNEEIYFPAISQRLLQINGVEYAENSGSGFAADSYITYEQVGSDAFFDFYIGWGDCPSGCMGGHTWHFKVDLTNCEVTHLGSETRDESGFVDATNCNSFVGVEAISSQLIALSIYPNPATGWLSVEAQNIKSIYLINPLGETVSQNDYPDQPNIATLHTSSLAAGVYFARVATAYGTFVQRIVIE